MNKNIECIIVIFSWHNTTYQFDVYEKSKSCVCALVDMMTDGCGVIHFIEKIYEQPNGVMESKLITDGLGNYKVV